MSAMRRDMQRDVSYWAHRPEIVDLVEAFSDHEVHLPDETGDRLAWLDRFSDRWDARQGKERDQAATLQLTATQEATVEAVTSSLGMRDQSLPARHHYDAILILGGLVRACFVRPAYAAQLLSDNATTTSAVVGLGGHRPFSEEEHTLATQAGHPDLADEFEALDAGLRTAFSLASPSRTAGEPSPVVGEGWAVHDYDGHGVGVTAAAAPSREPGIRRANTADAYHWWAGQWAHLPPRSSVLAITTPLYVPAQHAAALTTLALPFDLDVETIGTPPATGIWAQEFTATRYLMEVRSAIRSNRSLWVALTEGRTDRVR